MLWGTMQWFEVPLVYSQLLESKPCLDTWLYSYSAIYLPTYLPILSTYLILIVFLYQVYSHDPLRFLY